MSRPKIVGKLAYYHRAILLEFYTINLFNYLVDHRLVLSQKTKY